MLTIDDLFISLSVLICFRLSAFIVFFSRYFRDNKYRYGAISLGWLAYAVGPVFGLLEYVNTGDSNHPIFGYSAAVGTFLLMFGILLYHFKVTLQWFVSLFLFFVIGFGLLLSFYPEMSGVFGVTAQLLLIVSTLIIVVFKRKWLISISGKASYIWLSLFLLLSLLHAFGFIFWYSEMPISLRFVMTFLTNLFLYIFLLDFDWEQSFRKLRVSEANLNSSLKGKETLLYKLKKEIIERKQVEKELKQTEEQIKAALKEKNTLIDEIHHRVKNNMNIISSLLSLQANNIEDNQTKEILKQSQSRVYAMSAVHETLHGSANLSEIDLKSYLSKMTTSVFQVYSTDHHEVKLNNDVEEVPISLNQAYPLGLTINELISNSLKYAFPDDREGEISVAINKLDKELRLTVKDNGVGMPTDFDWKSSDTLGLKLARNLVENQLDGSIDMENTNGTKFTIKFNIET